MADDYPRDLIGYVQRPPDPGWPGQARIALQFVTAGSWAGRADLPLSGAL